MPSSSPFTGSSATKLGSVVTNSGVSCLLQTTGPTGCRVDIVSLPTSTTILRSLIGSLDNLFGGSNGKLLSSNVHLDTHWAVRVVDARDKAYYFDFPQLQRDETETSSNTSETWKWPSEAVQAITAEQFLGYTTYSPRKIEATCNKLQELWGTPHYHFWHSQHFSIFLTLLILDSNSLGDAQPQLRVLLTRLQEATGKWQATRHLTCIGGMFVLGVATGGLAIVPWAVAGGSLVSDGLAISDASTSEGKLIKNFPKIQTLLEGGQSSRR